MISGERRGAVVVLSSAFVLGLLGVVAPATASAAARTTADCTIFVVDGVATGTDGDDVICGTEGDDTIFGLGGNDTIFGLGGDDYIDTAAGNDWVSAGYGADEVVLGPGDDYSMGGPGADRLWGDAGADVIVGYSGDDSLVGGTGADDLDGGSGVDYCRKDSGDVLLSCYFDASAPSFVSVAIGTPSVSTTYAARVIAVRFRISDTGTGLATAELTFTRRLTTGAFINPITFSARTDYAEEACTPDLHAVEPMVGDTSICLVSGTSRSGVYEMRTWLPRWSPYGTYRLSTVRLRDAAGNSRGLPFDTLIDRGLAVSFKQVGPGDSTPPLVRSVEPLPSSISTYSEDRVVGARVHVTDAFTGAVGVGLEWARKVRSGGVVVQYLWPQPSMFLTTADAPLCGAGLPTVAELRASSTPYCRESGTPRDGWYRAYTVFPRWMGKGTYELTAVGTSDLAGNQRFLGPDEVEQSTLATQIYQVGPGDEAPATITRVTVQTPSVNASSSDVEVQIKVSAKDGLSGVQSLFVDFGPAVNPTQVGLSFSAGMDACGGDIVTDCLESGTRQNGVWRLSATLPAHSPAGTWTMGQVLVYDSAGNVSGTYTATRPAFTNS